MPPRRSSVSHAPSSTVNPGQFDRVLAITIFGLMLFGLIMISSASAINSFFNTKGQATDFYFWNQLKSLGIALVAWLIVQKIPYRFWYTYRFYVLGFSLCMLATVFTPLRSDYGTIARGWLNIPFLPSIQPSEIAKTGFIVYLAGFFDGLGPKLRDFKNGFIPFAIIVGIFLFFLIAEPDFGSILLYTMVAVSMFFVAQGRVTHILASGTLLAIPMAAVMSQKRYIVQRFTAFLDPGSDPSGIGYQIQQALIAIGSGGFFGYGFGNSRQKFAYLPEAQGDAIFAIASEELGFLRIALVIGAFAVIAWRGMKIAEHAPDRFAKYLATGIVCWICLEAFINMGVIMAILPNTGLTLPFISYGGSSLLSKAIAVGILINISRYSRETSHYRRGQWGAYPSFGRRTLSPKASHRQSKSWFRSLLARIPKWSRTKTEPRTKHTFSSRPRG